jgi:RNA polymerase sigma factor (sigma-70 family)
MDNLPDKEIIAAVLDGDKESYGILVDRYENLVFRLALRRLGDADMAEDIAQEAFLQGYQHLERLKNPASFASWISVITRNLCANIVRDRKLSTVSLEYLAETGIDPADEAKTPEYDKEMILAIRKLISKLPEKYREVVELRYAEEYSCNKIASFLDISVSAVLSRLFYARKRLLKMLKEEGLL